jgi:hypothetical protein
MDVNWVFACHYPTNFISHEQKARSGYTHANGLEDKPLACITEIAVPESASMKSTECSKDVRPRIKLEPIPCLAPRYPSSPQIAILAIVRLMNRTESNRLLARLLDPIIVRLNTYDAQDFCLGQSELLLMLSPSHVLSASFSPLEHSNCPLRSGPWSMNNLVAACGSIAFQSLQ